jgi:hypothetical protein
VLNKYGLADVNGTTVNKIPIVIHSANISTLEKVAAISDLPLMLSVTANQTLDLDLIQSVVNGIRPELDMIYH